MTQCQQALSKENYIVGLRRAKIRQIANRLDIDSIGSEQINRMLTDISSALSREEAIYGPKGCNILFHGQPKGTEKISVTAAELAFFLYQLARKTPSFEGGI